jgi:[FeFe] hydrogenase H-cluster maturation GTPase HydF
MKGKDLKPHIGIFGRRNYGKSSLINLLAGQDVAIVSEHAGTTTDPVKKSIEIFGIGPVIMVDTAGIDDSGDLGDKRVERTRQVLPTLDAAILVLAHNQFDEEELELIQQLNSFDVPYLILHQKSDLEILQSETLQKIRNNTEAPVLETNTIDLSMRDQIIEQLKQIVPTTAFVKPQLLAGMIKPKDVVLLVTPIDLAAPEGRMILPQVMTLRDVLDHDAICVTVKDSELEDFLKTGIKPALVVTDSQAFDFVSKLVPEDVPLTGFSIIFARMKGDFDAYLKGTPKLSNLKDGDKILMLESCTHQVTCDDIGRVKLPNWIKKFSGKNIEFDFISGIAPLPVDLSKYVLIIQCGGCMVTRKQVVNRIKMAAQQGVAVTNYGLAIAYLNGIFDRVVGPMRSISNP